MNLCKDCKHFGSKYIGVLGQTDVCNNERLGDRIHGKRMGLPAEAVRADMAQCGPEGRWFEAKPLETPPMPPNLAA